MLLIGKFGMTVQSSPEVDYAGRTSAMTDSTNSGADIEQGG